MHQEGGGGGKGGEDGGSDDSNGNRTQEFVVAVIRRRSPCTPARGIAMRLSLDPNKAAVLGVLFAPYNKEDGRAFTLQMYALGRIKWKRVRLNKSTPLISC